MVELKKCITINLKDFLKEVYNFDIDKYADYDNFCFESSFITDNDIDQKILKDMQVKYPAITLDKIKDSIKLAMFYNYENSYIEEYTEKLQNIISDKITYDFNHLSDFLFDELTDLKLNEDLLNELKSNNFEIKTDINFTDNTLKIYCDIDILSGLAITCINGYGMFGYNSIQEFYDSQPCNNKKEKVNYVINHLNWLSELENIYGSTYYFFTITDNDIENIDKYNCLGSLDCSIENIKNVLCENSLID